MPDKRPNCWLVIANSLFIVNAAKPMLIRSTKLITKRTKTKGIMWVCNFRIVLASIGAGATAGLVIMLPFGIKKREPDRPCERLANCSTGAALNRLRGASVVGYRF